MNIGEEICNAFGLKHCRKLVIYFEVDEIVKVEAELYPEENGVIFASTIIKKYKLVEKEES